ncbi:hypothetical protein DFH07DRAFT_806073 [Mycena maculata]|uniref:Transglutaminase-like domain-containing protein n=1 Tax=Mycena maculata TaxID=230809 RepID=A0AAD7JTJ1_9AGAR|nr:hypothetical protein DFH07DRAFT_806073 [Mycena maculata]
MSRPPLPPRRNVPPPPPPRAESSAPSGIAARIASLQLDQIGRNPQSARRNGNTLPPRAERDPQLAKALSRKPPPPPTAAKPVAPPPPLPARARRLPPMPTPEPEPEPEYEDPEEYGSDEGYQSQAESCIKCHDFSPIDDHAAQFPRQTVAGVQALAQDLTAPFESETEKARAIFAWLHHNIVYDTVSFFSGNLQPATPETTLRSGLAVCDGYAGLFVSLAEHAGLQAHKVNGHGKGYGYAALAPGEPVPPESSNHAWNCVLMDGEWRLVDPCWGAGALINGSYTQRLASSWFTSTPDEFGKRHFPTDPSYQLLPEPVSWEEYICEPEGPTVFDGFQTLDLQQDLLQPADAELQSGGWVAFCVFKRCEHMSRAPADNYVFFVNAPDDTKTPLEVNPEGGWGANIYFPRGARGEVSLNYVTQVGGRDAKGLTTHEFKNAIGRKSMAWGGMAKWRIV